MYYFLIQYMLQQARKKVKTWQHQHNTNMTNTTMKTLSKLFFLLIQITCLYAFGMFSLIFVPATMFLCGNKNAVGYSEQNPHEFGIAVFIVVFWLLTLISNLILPYVRRYIVYEDKVIKPGTWHSQYTGAE
jgi:hypothetical protein